MYGKTCRLGAVWLDGAQVQRTHSLKLGVGKHRSLHSSRCGLGLQAPSLRSMTPRVPALFRAFLVPNIKAASAGAMPQHAP